MKYHVTVKREAWPDIIKGWQAMDDEQRQHAIDQFAGLIQDFLTTKPVKGRAMVVITDDRVTIAPAGQATSVEVVEIP